MQLRLAVALAVARSCVIRGCRSLGQRVAFGSASTTRRTADPAVHSGNDGADPAVYPRDPEGVDYVANPKSVKEETRAETLPGPNKETEPLVQPKLPRATAQRLESTTPVSQTVEPNFQQRRQNSTVTAPPLDDVSCAGLDGTPVSGDAWEAANQRDESKVEETLSDKEYYKHHKASPLSEMEMADTRKPITQATDGTAAPSDYEMRKDVIRWRPEQLDTAEEALRRAVEIFRQNAARGDPETFPHSRVLREMRGEWF